MREKQLIVYRDFGKDGELLSRMSLLMENYQDAEKRGECCGLLYEGIYRLLEIAGSHGFSGNLWHCYLSNLLVNNENSYSRACEIRGEVDGTVNAAVLHDIEIFKEYFDFDFENLGKALDVPSVSMILNYQGNQQESKVYNTRIRDRICTLALGITNFHLW